MEAGEGLVAGPGRAGIEYETFGAGIAGGGGFIDLDDAAEVVEELDGDVIELRVLSGAEVVEGDGEARGGVVNGAEEIDDPDFGAFPGDDEGMWENSGFTGNPVVDLDAALNLEVVRDVDEEAIADGRLVERRVSGGAEAGFLLHEMSLDEFRMGDEGLCEWKADDAGRKLGFRME